MPSDRRQFLQRTGCLLFAVGEATLWLTPREARARAARYQLLSPGEVRTLEAVGEILVPGSVEAGLAHFVDNQLAVAPNDCLLIARSFNIEPPYQPFYRGALAAVERLAAERHRARFDEIPTAQAIALVREMSAPAADPRDWQGPPAAVAYLVLRSDAVDVVYGTVEGFRRLNVPYMPHILPPSPW